jgi:hypothetical protein
MADALDSKGSPDEEIRPEFQSFCVLLPHFRGKSVAAVGLRWSYVDGLEVSHP